MARKSRTQPKQSTDTLKALSKVYKTAIYVRLSAEKDETRDRKTLINQRNLIKNFVDQQMDMEVYDIYMDDEISGTTFDRPEFERMMSDMRAGRINCIVVKDLSRLGRDYIETGNLVERVFPMMNIRFVAITDNYDSSKKDADLMVAVTNIANDLYAKDISKKISSSKQEAMEKGIPTGNVAYGYKVVFNENKVKVMVEDKEAADVVRWIFNEAEKGTLHSVIAAELNAKHILTPAQYKVRHNIEKLEKLRGVKWTVDTISRILKNEVYIGRYVTGKDRVCLYRHEKRHTTNKDEWYVFENHHIALIAKEQFYAVQKNKRKVIKPAKNQTVNMLKGKSGLYADYTEELLDEKEYLQLNREYSQRIEKLKIQADEYRQAASQYESAEKTVAQLKAEMLRFKGKRKLTQEMVDLFVAQVRIYENKNLEIVLNYEDELKKFAELNMEREAG